MQVIKIDKVEEKNKTLNVCAYVRVSRDSDDNWNSFDQQMTYFKEMIKNNPDYHFMGVFGDYAETGTNINRPQLNKMIELCEKGGIDMIMTKSISRFSRNTVDLLETLRYLRLLNVDVYFEKENLHSLNMETEFILTILASIAQNESKSISDNIKWGIRKNFEKGIPNQFNLYGYKWDGNNFIVIPDEAEIIRHIYDLYLNGENTFHICKILKEEHIQTRLGCYFGNTSIKRILSNIKYTGCLELQKVYVVDHLSHKVKVNNGELPKYLIPNHHEAIIDEETFNKAQEITKLRLAKKYYSNKKWYLGHIKCAYCGNNYTIYQKCKGRSYFRCTGKTYKQCPSKTIIDKKLFALLKQYYGTEFFMDYIKNDIVYMTIDRKIIGALDEDN